MERVLVSACLVGGRVRYDGNAKTSADAVLARWRAEGVLVAFCPEVSGGLPVPRPPAEIENGLGGEAVLDGTARILTADGDDLTGYFVAGARLALAKARECGARVAILKEGSPSCGSLQIYDGTHSGRKLPGQGVTTALLEREGIRVFDEDHVAEAAQYLRATARPPLPPA